MHRFQRDVISSYTQIIRQPREHKDQGKTTEMFNKNQVKGAITVIQHHLDEEVMR